MLQAEIPEGSQDRMNEAVIGLIFLQDEIADHIQSASIARFQGLVKSVCISSSDRWAILQLLCSQARRQLQEELQQKVFTKPRDRAIAELCTSVDLPVNIHLLNMSLFYNRHVLYAVRFANFGISRASPRFLSPSPSLPSLGIFCLNGHKVGFAVVHNDSGEESVVVAVTGVGSDKGEVDGIGRAPVAAELVDALAGVHRHDDVLVAAAAAAGVEVTQKSLPGKRKIHMMLTQMIFCSMTNKFIGRYRLSASQVKSGQNRELCNPSPGDEWKR